MWQGSAALLVENVVHKWRALWQDLEAQRDAVHVIVCNRLLGQRGLAQVQHSDHDQHGLRHKGLRGTAARQHGLDARAAGSIIFSKRGVREEGTSYVLFLFVLNYGNVAQGHFGQCGGQGSCHIKVSIHQEASEWRSAATTTPGFIECVSLYNQLNITGKR